MRRRSRCRQDHRRGESLGSRVARFFECLLQVISSPTCRSCSWICSEDAATCIACKSRWSPTGARSTATRASFAMISLRSSSRFTPKSFVRLVKPVIFPPGCPRLATSPSPTGSAPLTMMIGIVFVSANTSTSDHIVLYENKINLQPNQFRCERREAI
jgi:hypothetical protein